MDINVTKGSILKTIELNDFKKEFSQYLQCENLNFLLGSGASSLIIDGEEKSIPTMAGLFNRFFEQNPDFKIADVDPKDKCDFNLETMMDYMVSIKMSNHIVSVDNEIDEKIKIVKEFLKNAIISGQTNETVLGYYKLMYLKLVQIKSKSAINVFTTNYDQYNEKALDTLGFYYNNGFTGTCIRKFNPNSYNYIFVENMNLQKDVWGRLSSFFNIYKLHGSINWFSEGEEILEKPIELCDAERMMIYPTPKKDRTTLMTPYSDLMRSMQQTIVKNNSVLITLGYSFSDVHINRIILNALSNPTFKLIVLGQGENIQKLIDLDDKRIIIVNSSDKIHYFYNFVNDLLPDIDDLTTEELNLKKGISALNSFFNKENTE